MDREVEREKERKKEREGERERGKIERERDIEIGGIKKVWRE